MNAIDLYQHLLRSAHGFLDDTMADVTDSHLTWDPPGKAFSIAANYAHVLTSEDLGVQGLLKGQQPLALSTWADRLGASEPPPLGPGGDLKGWSQRAKLDLPALQRYGKAVRAATDEYLAGMKESELDRPLDLSRYGFGQQTVLFIVTALLANVSLHTGEISCLKGLQGAKGYPV